MREQTRTFCRLAAEIFEPEEPIYEFGAYQVEGQEGFADLRPFFSGRQYIGCDMRPGPGVDRIEDVADLRLDDLAAGTVVAIDTFEHVFEARRGFDEVFRVLKPGGLLIMTVPFNVRIHGYPEDYWRYTPRCIELLLEPYEAAVVGYQGHEKLPHTIFGLAFKDPAPVGFRTRAERLVAELQAEIHRGLRSLSLGQRIARFALGTFGFKDGRRHVAGFYRSAFSIRTAQSSELARTAK